MTEQIWAVSRVTNESVHNITWNMSMCQLGFFVAMAYKEAGIKGVGRKPDETSVLKALSLIKDK